MISYYELLGMIKEGNIPNKIKVHLTPVSSRNYISEYDIDGSFTYYRLENEKEENDDYRFYLADCYLETTALDETIEILDEKKIEQIKTKRGYGGLNYIKDCDCGEYDGSGALSEKELVVINKINEIIDIINKEE